jgi:hypothetical protein
MCDLGLGEVLVARPRGGPGGELAQVALGEIHEEFPAVVDDDMDAALERITFGPDVGVNRIEPHAHFKKDQKQFFEPEVSRPPFILERWRVPEGQELEFVSSLQDRYLSTLLRHSEMMPAIAADSHAQMRVSPNWRLRTSALDDGFTGSFLLSPNNLRHVESLGVGVSECCGAGTTIAVLDTGFDSATWSPADPTLTARIATPVDLLPGASGAFSHGTLVAALATSAAPASTVCPIRIAGADSTDWDAIRALYVARQIGADVAVLAFRQVLVEAPCPACGLVRSGARSEVFAKAVEHVTADNNLAVVVAAGNSGMPELARPASYPGALAVAALDAGSSSLANYSNWDGRGAFQVWALPGTEVALSDANQPLSGTSFACAYAGGLIASAISHSHVTAGEAINRMTVDAVATDKNALVPHL